MFAKLLGGIWPIRKKYHQTHNKLLRAFYSLIYHAALQSKSSWISLDATFLGEPCLPHGEYGIFISGAAVVGKNCVIFQQVSIGSNTLSDSGGAGAPNIGDNCYIGAGAKIVGDVRIGDNVRIGANAFVYQDISDNSVITCGTPRIIRMRRPLINRFYHKYQGEWRYFNDGHWNKVKDQKELARLARRFGN
jgi:serine O-acetyltransferase